MRTEALSLGVEIKKSLIQGSQTCLLTQSTPRDSAAINPTHSPPTRQCNCYFSVNFPFLSERVKVLPLLYLPSQVLHCDQEEVTRGFIMTKCRQLFQRKTSKRKLSWVQ